MSDKRRAITVQELRSLLKGLDDDIKVYLETPRNFEILPCAQVDIRMSPETPQVVLSFFTW
jgi:hypothetical protein